MLKLFSLLFLFQFSTAFGADFTGAVKINECSGSLIRFSFSESSDPALVLSAGHCAALPSMIRYGQYASHFANSSTVSFLHADGSLNLLTAQSIDLVYATMTDTDVSIYVLNESYDQIQKRIGVRALVVSAKPPQAGEAITILSGQLQKSYHCHIDSFIFRLILGEYIWKDSIRYSELGCDVISGTSGSPIVSDVTREVVGVNNVGNSGGGVDCDSKTPCEVSVDGSIKTQVGINYGQQAYLIATCFNILREFDLSVPHCQLYH